MKPKTGMVLGKFLPPHLGHLYLVEFARAYVERLTVVVGTLANEPIPGALRHRWMRELFPDVHVVHLTDENPQYPEEHPDFWRIWKESLRRVLPEPPECVFASEDYGAPLAQVLGARFVPADIARGIVPISGTAVRSDPLAAWDYLPRCVQPYFLRRVCIFGPESTGKSTLTRQLAEAYRTRFVPEYARDYLERRAGEVRFEDMEPIARGQLASETALSRSANRVLFSDTDLLTTRIWSETLFGRCDAFVAAAAEAQRHDLYLLTDVDVPFVPDVIRYLPHRRAEFLERCRNALTSRARPHVLLSGSWEQRMATARAAVDALLGTPGG